MHDQIPHRYGFRSQPSGFVSRGCRREDRHPLGAEHVLLGLPDHRQIKSPSGAGVTKAVVSYADKTAVVTFDDAQTAVPALIAATTNAGYPSALKS
jgi:copper chaperone CopZ